MIFLYFRQLINFEGPLSAQQYKLETRKVARAKKQSDKNWKMYKLFCLQVVDKDADAVLDEVEAAIFLVAQSILAGQGFSYAVPSRAKGNQLYVPEIDRIVLKDSASARPFANTSTCR